MNRSDKPKRPLGLGGYAATIGITMVVAILAGVGNEMFGDQPGVISLVLSIAMNSVAVAVGFAACLWWWRGIDEAAREAHKWAWWWGGSGGIAVGGVLMLTLASRDDGSTSQSVGASAPELVAGGMFAILLFQMAGYAVAWAGWWLRR